MKKLTNSARRHIVDDDLLDAYRRMSEDRAREAEAEEWIEGLDEDGAPQPG
jgi:hypothetical protein